MTDRWFEGKIPPICSNCTVSFFFSNSIHVMNRIFFKCELLFKQPKILYIRQNHALLCSTFILLQITSERGRSPLISLICPTSNAFISFHHCSRKLYGYKLKILIFSPHQMKLYIRAF